MFSSVRYSEQINILTMIYRSNILQRRDCWWRWSSIIVVTGQTSPQELFWDTWISLPADSIQSINFLENLDSNNWNYRVSKIKNLARSKGRFHMYKKCYIYTHHLLGFFLIVETQQQHKFPLHWLEEEASTSAFSQAVRCNCLHRISLAFWCVLLKFLCLIF